MFRKKRREGFQDLFPVADQIDVNPGATAQLFAANVDLNDVDAFGIRLRLRKVGAEYQEGFEVVLSRQLPSSNQEGTQSLPLVQLTIN
jgi:hypothetical protein